MKGLKVCASLCKLSFVYIISDVINYRFLPYSCLAALLEQRNASGAAGIGSTVGESSPTERTAASKDKIEEHYESLGLNIERIPIDLESHQGILAQPRNGEIQFDGVIDSGPSVVEEHDFIPRFSKESPVVQTSHEDTMVLNNLAVFRGSSSEDEVSVSLQLGETEPKRRKHSES